MRLIDADALRETIYHEAFETDTDMQKQDSGCWIRYKMFENALENAPTIDAEPIRHGKWLMSDVYGAYCSECGDAAFEITGSQYSKMKTRYCWHCGARMDKE